MSGIVADRPLRLADVAARFGKSLSWLHHNIRRLRTQHGFPAPIPGFGHVYDPLAIEQWLGRQREAAVAVAEPVATVDADWAVILDQRAAALARPAGHA